jgi:predicted RecB family endonuclease
MDRDPRVEPRAGDRILRSQDGKFVDVTNVCAETDRVTYYTEVGVGASLHIDGFRKLYVNATIIHAEDE